jgi:hypothetical protein
MSIHCAQCRTALPEGGAFCWRCGSVARSATEATGPVAYEACEIVYGTPHHKGEVVFWARATGKSGTFSAAESEPLQRDETGTYLVGKDTRAALDRLLADLAGQGWESLGIHGCDFWDHRLRRRVTAQAGAAGG